MKSNKPGAIYLCTVCALEHTALVSTTSELNFQHCKKVCVALLKVSIETFTFTIFSAAFSKCNRRKGLIRDVSHFFKLYFDMIDPHAATSEQSWQFAYEFINLNLIANNP